MVPVDLEQSNGVHTINGKINGVAKESPQRGRPAVAAHKVNPYAPRYADFLSNVSDFNIIESTLRGEYHQTSSSNQI